MSDPVFWKLPTAEEILAGETQAGVPRPTVSLDDARVQWVAPDADLPPARPSFWVRARKWLCSIFDRRIT